MSGDYDLNLYRVAPFIHATMDSMPINMIDFKRHLTPAVALNKVITMGNDGRPTKAEYFNGTELQCRIDFAFTVDGDNFMTSRTETLYYIKTDGTDGPAVVIKSKTFDPASLSDGSLIMAERVAARSTILEEIKAFTAGVLKLAPMTITQVIATIKPFWDDHTFERSDFIELGSEDFKDAITAVDTAVAYTWLATVIDGNGTTLKDYFIARLSY